MKRDNRIIIILFAILCIASNCLAEDGSELWLRYRGGMRAMINVPCESPTMDIVRQELSRGWRGKMVALKFEKMKGKPADSYKITDTGDQLVISSPTEKGLLYGTYALLRMRACGVDMDNTSVSGSKVTSEQSPAYDLRILNHWDNLDGTIERGYAGKSLWNWDELPTLSPRYETYARANASIGINGTVLNNVNASPQILSNEYLLKVKALADLFRPYGLRVYLSVNFASPMVLGKLATADPKDKQVIKWWKNKAKEIYSLIPDFGGFLVKANSEGQPGPCDFGRTHADGANMLADALKPYKGIVMWRAFVYSPSDADRAKQAYIEFMPFDGTFRENVIIQVKNGPVDFQPREPYSPLFTAITKTPLMAEFQVTQEYTGHSNHLCYLAPMWKEFFSLVEPASLKAIAGVANIGNDTNWCGHPLAQSNWYAFGRLAWDPSLTSKEISEEWVRQTITTEPKAVNSLTTMFLDSHEAVVDYMMPLGLHHIFAWGHHYGPEPWCDVKGARADWLPRYYHQADANGLGFNRSSTGSNAVAQYPETLCKLYDDINTCPEEYILWFHHTPWTHKMKNGRTLWNELCYRYDNGVKKARDFQRIWDEAEPYIDSEIFKNVQQRLQAQTRDAQWWKDACLLYFQQYSRQPIPYDIERPVHTLDALMKVKLGITNYECPTIRLLNRIR